jgi:hypothetical protein
LGPHQEGLADREGGRCRDSPFPGQDPIRIDRLPVGSRLEDLPRLFRREVERLCDLDQYSGLADISFIHKIGREKGQVIFLSLPLKFRPFPKLLGQAAVIGPRSLPKGETQLPGLPLQADPHLFDVYESIREEFLQGETLFRCVRAKRKGTPADFDDKGLFQFLNTSRTEIAPGSDII